MKTVRLLVLNIRMGNISRDRTSWPITKWGSEVWETIMDSNVASNVTMDFFGDIADRCKNELIAAAYPVDSADTADLLVLKYLNVLHRRISRRPRKIHVSNELQCPPKYQAGFALLKKKAQQGQDLSPYQSREFPKAADFNDGLFSDWGIHHFHLGTKLKHGLIKGTKEVLFARVTADDFYCISIMDHKSWSNQDLLRIIHGNWPQLANDVKINFDTVGPAQKYTDAEIASLRRARINTITSDVNGMIYGPLGGGQTTAGTSSIVAMQRANLVRFCRKLEKLTRKRLSESHEKAEEGIVPETPKHLRLQIVNGKMSAVSEDSKITIELEGTLNIQPLV